MSRSDLLDILMLLSALESWAYSMKQPLPEYLHEKLKYSIDNLIEELLKDEA